MYEYALKSRFDPRLPCTPGDDPVLRHDGPYGDILKKHRQHAARVAAGIPDDPPIGDVLFRRVADARTMRCAIEELARFGGQAAGPDGLHFADLDGGERWSLCRALAESVLQGTYRPGDERPVEIPKGSGRGTRTIKVANIQDRTVGRALQLILDPVLDPKLSPFVVGFRPRVGTQTALAIAMTLAAAERRTVWVVEDVANAFDAVPRPRFLSLCRNRFTPELVNLIDVISGSGPKGLLQGCPAAPLLWNLFGDRFIDRPAQQRGVTRLLRYADDILLQCRSVEEAQEHRAVLAQVARSAGTPLKSTSAGTSIADLGQGMPVEWLGYRLQRRGPELTLTIGDRAWDKLEEHLAEVQHEPAAPVRAIGIIKGWLAYRGPCFRHEPRRPALRRLRDMAAAQGFREIPTIAEMEAIWQRGYARWCSVLDFEYRALPSRLARLQIWNSMRT